MHVPEVQARAPEAVSRPEPLLSVRHVVKAFGPVRAVDDVSLDIFPQEVVGLIGDNGAGKSTFLSLLTGYYRPDSGQFIYKGRPVTITSPRESRHNLKIEMIYQNLRLAPDLRVSDNLFLGEEPRTFGLFLDRKQMQRSSADVLRKLKLKITPKDVVGKLSGGEQQAVAIGRALLFDRDIILMDEPTAAISVSKVQDVLNTIRSLKEHGKTVILVSHRLEDILEVSDRIVVFFHSRIRDVLKNEQLQISDLIHLMFDSGQQEV
jgi:simple sugar transport system ATP-binding protein